MFVPWTLEGFRVDRVPKTSQFADHNKKIQYVFFTKTANVTEKTTRTSETIKHFYDLFFKRNDRVFGETVE